MKSQERVAKQAQTIKNAVIEEVSKLAEGLSQRVSALDRESDKKALASLVESKTNLELFCDDSAWFSLDAAWRQIPLILAGRAQIKGEKTDPVPYFFFEFNRFCEGKAS